jgi:hypothetical protein
MLTIVCFHSKIYETELNLMNQNGYVSIEFIVVAGLILSAGIWILANFILDGGTAAESAQLDFENSYVEAIMAGE